MSPAIGLWRTDADPIGLALQRWDKRQRRRAELAQKNTRNRARFLFVSAWLAAWAGDQFMCFCTLEGLIDALAMVTDGD